MNDDQQPMVSDLLRNATAMMRDPSVSEEEVAKMLATALQESARNLDAPPQQLYRELEGLADYIQNTRQELSALHDAESVSSEHIPHASDQLDAVVAATEEATNTIMNCCDDIGAIAGRVGGDDGVALTNLVTQIFEACNFQDITGQRIGKVVKTLQHIETHITKLVDAFGGPKGRPGAPANDVMTGDAALMNGPQLPGSATSQDDIDKLLAGFDEVAQ